MGSSLWRAVEAHERHQMGLKFHPAPGSIVICDYSTGFRAPEMVKKRPAVVVSPRLPHRDGLLTVVPLSRTPPKNPVKYQCLLTLTQDIPSYEGREKWAKADMLATVGMDRIDLPRLERDRASGLRRYLTMKVTPDQLKLIQTAVLHALGMSDLADQR